jgi:hypothetical protein
LEDSTSGEPAGVTPSGPGKLLASEQIDVAGSAHPVLITPGLPARRTFGPVVVPAGHYFVLGDNRDISADSRYLGFVPLNSITGRSSRVLFSLDAAHWYLPRWGRTLSALP